jgi:4-amino-4-deoxy-L-arabinose transferase-like glycosyltransferase
MRLFAAVDWNSAHPDNSQRLNGDEPGYDNLARDLLQGQGFTWPGRVPLYPIWLAGIYLVTGGSYDGVAYAQSFLGVLTILLTYVLGRRVFGHTAGLIAAFFMTFNPVHIHWTGRLYSEALYAPTVLLVTLTLWDAFHKPNGKRFLWAGAAVGMSNLVRPALLLFPFCLTVLLFLVRRKRQVIRYGLIYSGVSLLVVMPWVIHNYVRYHALFALQTSSAILWQASPEYYHLIHDEGYTHTRIWTEVLYGPGWQEHDPNSIEGDRYWTQRALQSIASEPLVYLKYAGEKLFTYWVGDPNADWGDTHVFNYQRLRQLGYPRRVVIQYMIARTLPIFASIAVFVLRRKWKVLLPIYALLAYLNFLHAATHAEVRLSDPLQPLLLILVARAATVVMARAKEAA